MTNTGIKIDYIKNCLARGRLAHAWLFTGGTLDRLISAAREVAMLLKCENPPDKAANGYPLRNCNFCSNCVRIKNDNHPEVFWLYPESKMRFISVEAVRNLINEVQMKPLEGGVKIAIIVGADRMNQSAANAFLKTLEEPPAQSIIILLSTEPHRLLETIVSRCQKIDFGQTESIEFKKYTDFLEKFISELIALHGAILPRYRLLDLIVKELEGIRQEINTELTQQSILKKYEDIEIDRETVEKFEKELKAAVEAEYRRRRQELIGVILWFFRDVWLLTIDHNLSGLLSFPQFREKVTTISSKITKKEALENLEVIEESQKLLHTNVQESLILETMLLRIKI